MRRKHLFYSLLVRPGGGEGGYDLMISGVQLDHRSITKLNQPVLVLYVPMQVPLMASASTLGHRGKTSFMLVIIFLVMS